MKLRRLSFIFIVCFIFMSGISAKEEILNCEYKKEKETITIKLYTDYTFKVSTNFIKEKYEKKDVGAGVEKIESVSIANELQYNDFLTENNKFNCRNSVYLNLYNETGGSRSGASDIKTYYISTKKQAEKIETGTWGAKVYYASKEYKKNKSSSKVSVKSPGKANKKEGWLKTCNYGSIIFRFNKEKYEFVSGGINLDPRFGDIMTELSENKWTCPISICSSTNTGYGYSVTNYRFYFDYSKVGDSSCQTAAEYSDEKFSCVGVNQYYEEFVKNNSNYAESKLAKDFALRNESKEKLNAFCNSVFSSLNYTDSNKCVKDCMEAVKLVESELEIPNDGQCNLSGRMINWIKNILKWIKYILPVFVIILGILDFIKAISSGSDDEMKKAQGRFIKRLIAAALLFLIPALIEFILEVFKIESTFCGIV